MNRHFAATLLLGSLLLAPGCNETVPSAGSTAGPQTLTLATTTSTRDSGLLEVLLPMFREQTGIEVKVIAVGSGQALELGRRGDADVLLTHAPEAEDQFVKDGFAKERIPVFHNDFIVIGPSGGPLHKRPVDSLNNALQRIASDNLLFVSRGDDSGTHRKEQELWKTVAIEPDFSNYLSAGSGMAQTLRIAQEKQGYTLTDRGTFLVLRSELSLQVVIEGDLRMLNPYAVMAIDPARHSHVHAEAADRFIRFLRQTSTRQTISKFGRMEYGQSLFFVE